MILYIDKIKVYELIGLNKNAFSYNFSMFGEICSGCTINGIAITECQFFCRSNGQFIWILFPADAYNSI